MVEKLFQNAESLYPFSINLNWYGSKGVVSTFARSCLETLQEQSKDRKPSDISAGLMEGFIYDLSHGRREFSTFPNSFTLHVSEIKSRIIMNGGAFWAQLVDQLTDYFEEQDSQFKPSILRPNSPSVEYFRHMTRLKRLADTQSQVDLEIQLERNSTLGSATIVKMNQL